MLGPVRAKHVVRHDAQGNPACLALTGPSMAPGTSTFSPTPVHQRSSAFICGFKLFSHILRVMNIPFTKMHGIGNDYIYVNGFETVIDAKADLADLARRISDRHFGVGGDGLILVLPPEKRVQADVRMRMFNADGSEAEMCGNGIRCVCKL